MGSSARSTGIGMRETHLVQELLGFIERREARLLAWGFYDVALDDIELSREIEANAPTSLKKGLLEFEEGGETLGDLLTAVHYQRLLHRVSSNPVRYRNIWVVETK